MKTFLVSTTIGHNSGDEIIWNGIRNLLTEGFQTKHNYIYYNRNPDLQEGSQRFARQNTVGNYMCGSVDLSEVDGVILAGSPEWFGGPMLALYEALDRHPDIPIYALGIGLGSRGHIFSDLEKRILKRARVVTRSHETVEELNGIGVASVALPCPALFSSLFTLSTERVTTQTPLVVVQKPGHGWHEIHSKYLDGLDIEDELCAIHIKEFQFFKVMGYDVRYAYSPGDLGRQFGNREYVISTRLHSAIAALSLGIPAAVVGRDDFRIRTAAAMFSPIVSNYVNIAEAKAAPRIDCQKILDFKSQVWDAWMEELEKCSELVSD